MPYPDIKPEPNFERLQTTLARGLPDRVPFIELFLDEPIMVAVREAPFSSDLQARCREFADLYFRLGYDYVPAATSFGFPYRTVAAEDTAALSMGQRNWVQGRGGTIETWDAVH